MKVNWRSAVFSTVLAFAGYQTAQAQTPSYNISDSAVHYTRLLTSEMTVQ